MGCFLFLLVLQCGRSIRNLRLPGSGRQLMKTSHLAQFESYAAKGALLRQRGAKGNQTIPSTPPEIIKTPTKSVGALFLGGNPPLFCTKLPVCITKLSNNRITPPLTYNAQNHRGNFSFSYP